MKKLAFAALAAIALSGFTYKANHQKTISSTNGVSNGYNWGMFLPGVFFASQYVLVGSEFTPGSLVCQSPNAQYKLWYQTDGNLVLYKVPGTPIWATLTVVTLADKVVFDPSGDVYCFRQNNTNIYWQAHTAYPGPIPSYPIYWVLQDDGNFVRYWGTPGHPDTAAPSISTNTSGGQNSPNYGSFQ
jgi:hypothetical protein